MRSHSRVTQLAFATAGILLAQMAISLPLWGVAPRSFPLTGLWPLAGQAIGAVLLPLFSAVIIGAMLLAVFSRHRALAWALFLASGCALVVIDLNCLQAWWYQYLLISVLLILFYTQRLNESQALYLLRVLLAGIYCWGGIHKINLHFATDVFPWLCGILPFTGSLSDRPMLAYLIGGLEAIAGLLLLLRPTMRAGAGYLVLFHLAILVLLIADGWNAVVYPWNVLMPLLLLGLTLRLPPAVSAEKEKPSGWFLGGKVYVYSLAFVLPAGYLSGHIDSGLSFSMYAGIVPEAYIVSQKLSDDCIPLSVQQKAQPLREGWQELLLDDWTLKEFRTPVYASPYVHRRVFRTICECSVSRDSLLLLLVEYKRWTIKGKETVYRCDEVLPLAAGRGEGY